MAKLYFRYGAMNCGKTTHLMMTSHNFEEQGMKAVIIKPKIDLKGNNKIVSRGLGEKKIDEIIDENTNIYELIDNKYQNARCILVDEAQFLLPKQIDELLLITTKLDIPVIAYGLRTDFLTHGFPGSTILLQVSHSIEEMKTICKCGKKATFVIRKIDGKDVFSGKQVAIDGKANIAYESVCSKCYQERKETIQKQTTSSFHFISVSFIAFFIFGMLISCITSVTQHLPGYGESLGYPLTTCAMLLSAGMMGNIVSKLIIGSLSDYFGEMKATLMMIGVNILGIILLMIGKSMVLLIIGAFMFGSCYSLGAVAVPLLTKYFFKTENYAKAFPTISFASNVGAAISLSLVGYIYDFFGSYLYAFIIALTMIMISLALLFIVTKTKEN